MGLSQHRTFHKPYPQQRIPAPPSAARFDAVFVNAVADLASMVRESSAPRDDDRG